MRRMWTAGLALGLLVPGGATAVDGQEPVERRMGALRAEAARVSAEAGLREAELARAARALRVVSRRQAAEVRLQSERVRAELAARANLLPVRARMQARAVAPEAWLPQDPADSLYREARSRLNARRYAEAARLFEEIRAQYPRSGYVGDAFYFEALARSRVGARAELQAALELLAAQRSAHPSAATATDARALAVRIEGQLARRGDAQAAEALMGAARGAASQTACDEEDQALRATALSALLQMDPSRARPILQDVLRGRDECSSGLRAQAVFILAQHIGEAPDDGTIDLLLDLAHRDPDPDPEVREAAVFWLSQTGRPEAVDALVQILASGDAGPEIAEKAIFALGQSGDPRALEVLRDYAADRTADPGLRGNAIFWLGQAGGDEATGFLRTLYPSLEDRELKERVFFSIAEHGSADGLDWLIARALDPQEAGEVRKTALFWAGEAGLTPRQALEIYRSAEHRELREQAIFVLTQVADDDEAVDALMEIARSEEDPELRQQAVFWLGQSDDPRVAEFLLGIIRGGGGA